MHLSYAGGDGPDPHRRFAMPNHWQYQRAILQEETGEEDRYEGDSEGELCGREIESDAEIESVVEKRIPDVGRVAMLQNSLNGEWS
jgi:hypothetical protein